MKGGAGCGSVSKFLVLWKIMFFVHILILKRLVVPDKEIEFIFTCNGILMKPSRCHRDVPRDFL